MPLPRITSDTPSIQDIWLYTYRIRKNRWDYMDRDILPSKIKVIESKVYKKNKEGKYTTPDIQLKVISYSAPQYYPYTKNKKKDSKRQMKIKHHYDITLVLQKDNDDQFSFNSKLVWRVGSYKKWKYAPQSKVKTIYISTRNKLKQKYTDKKTNKLNKEAYKKALESIQKTGKYLDNGDYNSQELGLNGDFYFRVMPMCIKFNCLFGPKTNSEPHAREKDIQYPFFGKHELAVLLYLLKKKILIR